MSRPIRLILLCLGLLLAPALIAQEDSLEGRLRPHLEAHPGQSGLALLDRGEESLLARAWLADQTRHTLDVQYFIWSTDNVGKLACEAFLKAAERGVKVRILVDDLLIDAKAEPMLALARHPNIDLRIYNPQLTVGTNPLSRVGHLLRDLRGVNQRMHDKLALFDGQVGISGGRNMADEYFDLDRRYSFRDRDLLAVGPVVKEMTASFERFWQSPLSVPAERLLTRAQKRLDERSIQAWYQRLHAYAADPGNLKPAVKAAIDGFPKVLERLKAEMAWSEVRFLSDVPGKNPGLQGLQGGGRSTDALVEVLESTQRTVTIQSPYVVLSQKGLKLFKGLIARGVKVRVSTNSLASTDNLMAFGGYSRQRARLLKAGIEISEFRPDPAVRNELIGEHAPNRTPTFGLHAKTLVVDGKRLFVGTFNLDPRSAHLNTEVGLLAHCPALAARIEADILRDMAPGNSWPASSNPDRHAPFLKRQHLKVWKALPLNPLL